MISPGSNGRPCALPSHLATAARRAGVPSTSVYLVAPASSARLAASLMCEGVSKSGSPAPKLMTSSPLARRAAALAETASVGDGSMRDRRRESFTGRLLLSSYFVSLRFRFDSLAGRALELRLLEPPGQRG